MPGEAPLQSQGDRVDAALVALFDALDIGVIVADQTLTIEAITQAAHPWLGVSAQAARGLSLTEAVPALAASEPELRAVAEGYSDRFELLRLSPHAAPTTTARFLAFPRQRAAPAGLLLAFCAEGDSALEGLVGQLRHELFQARQQALLATRRADIASAHADALLAPLRARHLPLATAIGAIAEAGVAVVAGDVAFVGQLQAETLEISWWPSTEPWGEPLSLPRRAEGLAGALEAGLLPFASANSSRDALLDEEVKIVLGEGSLLILPLLTTAGEPFGLIGWHSPERHRHIDAAARAVLEMLARDAALLWENDRLHQELQRQETHDLLTGLPNTAQLLPCLAPLLARTTERRHPLSVMMLHIDDLQTINERFGRQRGDDLIRALASAARGRLRQHDVVLRSSPAELTLLLPGTSLGGAQTLAQALGRAFALTEIAPHLRPTTSIGIAASPDHGATPEVLLAAARAALTRARAMGSGHVCVAR